VSDARVLREAAAGPLARRFPSRWLEEHAVLPLEVVGDVVRVAADGAPPAHVREAIERRLGTTVALVPAGAGDIRAALLAAPRDPRSDAHGNATGDVPRDMQRDTERDSQRGREPNAVMDGTESLDDLRALASREPVVQVVNAMLAEAARAGASDVHVESLPDGVRVRMRIDGVLHDAQRLGTDFRAAVISRLKVLSGLDIAERRLPQDGRARVAVGTREMDLRVSTLPALHGESVVVRLLDGGGDEARSLDTLGLAPALLGALRALLQRQAGLVLVCGPTGSGKTTTLYAALRERSTPGVKVVTVEDPVEYRLDGIVQLPVNTRAGFGFANALRAILRHDPDVILVGEMRDAETADIAVRAALTGHLVLSTIHTTDAVGALARLRDMGVPAYLLSATLQGVLAQRLVRRVCDGCGQWRASDPRERAWLHAHDADAADRVREGAGCEQCARTGYRGRVALMELLPVSESLMQAFADGAPTASLRALVRAQGVRSLSDDAVRLVREGVTSVAEVWRVLGATSDDVASDA
jgi:type II secretory ATPase GspE/PulE/Tfp pilus assembly ATPase PilB-like protein